MGVVIQVNAYEVDVVVPWVMMVQMVGWLVVGSPDPLDITSASLTKYLLGAPISGHIVLRGLPGILPCTPWVPVSIHFMGESQQDGKSPLSGCRRPIMQSVVLLARGDLPEQWIPLAFWIPRFPRNERCCPMISGKSAKSGRKRWAAC
jgi:hypothetical protein